MCYFLLCLIVIPQTISLYHLLNSNYVFVLILASFSWDDYLHENGGEPAPLRCFKQVCHCQTKQHQVFYAIFPKIEVSRFFF